jgi:enamine deaminase RidA (YjgF/YER057c/UK114 family)
MDRKSFTPDSLSNYRDSWHMSPGIASNGLLFLTGMTGNRGDDTFASDADEQIRDAFAKITAVLNEAGLDYSKVVEMTSYHLGIHDHIDVFRKIRDEYVVEPYPAWTAIEVSGFITDGAIVEIRVVADASSIA